MTTCLLECDIDEFNLKVNKIRCLLKDEEEEGLVETTFQQSKFLCEAQYDTPQSVKPKNRKW